MPRGGARIGAGRPKKGEVRGKAVPAKPKAPTAKPAAPVTKPASTNDRREPNLPPTEVVEPQTARSPLQYMLDVMNDPGADERLRSQMAVAAAPYMHAKKGEGGKKDEQADKAKQAAAGRFKAAAPPLKLVGRK